MHSSWGMMYSGGWGHGVKGRAFLYFYNTKESEFFSNSIKNPEFPSNGINVPFDPGDISDRSRPTTTKRCRNRLHRPRLRESDQLKVLDPDWKYPKTQRLRRQKSWSATCYPNLCAASYGTVFDQINFNLIAAPDLVRISLAGDQTHTPDCKPAQEGSSRSLKPFRSGLEKTSPRLLL